MAQWAVCVCQFIRAAAAIMGPEIGLWMHISLSPLELRVSSASRERTNKVTMTNIDGALSLLPNRFMATCICPLKNYRFRPIHNFFLLLLNYTCAFANLRCFVRKPGVVKYLPNV